MSAPDAELKLHINDLRLNSILASRVSDPFYFRVWNRYTVSIRPDLKLNNKLLSEITYLAIYMAIKII